jgi:tRNA-2-methylthio-N6-dimethylallyladenosine synthase
VQKTFFIKTFGCQMNERDSEIIAQSLSEHNYIESTDLAGADLVILNTCSIRAKAEQKVMSLLGYLRKEKSKNPSMKICVAGCVAQQEGEKIIKKMGHVDLIVGTQNIYDIPSLLDKNEEKGKVAIELSDNYEIPEFIPNFSLPKHGEPSSRSGAGFRKFVTIMQGCNNFCTYCVVPYTRGREVSRKRIDIINEVKTLVDAGVVEVTLLGQNVNSYGIANIVTEDGSPYSFPNLLKDVSKIEKLQRLRFTTSHPKDLSVELMECFRDIDILCPQFHLPVQAGSNDILKKMNRKYTIESYLEKVWQLQDFCKEIVITTDIIVGFPGETEEDFSRTMQLLEEVRFAGSFSFKYSDRPGTASEKLSGKIPEETKSRRLAIFQKRQDEISLEHNKSYLGKILPVLVETADNGSVKSRSNTNHIVHIKNYEKAIPGTIVRAEIIHAGQHSLQGKILAP